MERKELTLEQKKELYHVALGIAGVQFDNNDIVELLIIVYERMIELNGAVGVDELIKMRAEFMKKNPQLNEQSGKKSDK